MIAYVKAKLAALHAATQGWKTVAFGIAVSALGTWDALAASGFDMATFVPPGYRPELLALTGLLVVGLRFVTTTSIGASTLGQTPVAPLVAPVAPAALAAPVAPVMAAVAVAPVAATALPPALAAPVAAALGALPTGE